MPGALIIISGPSGVGKTTICRQIVEALDAFLSVSATTRPPRKGEVDGVSYRFMNREAFLEQLERGAFLEYAEVYGGHYYGTPAEPVRQALETGRAVVLEIEIDGTIQVMRRYPEAVSVYILAPTAADQQDRILGRKKDSADAIAERLSKADAEIQQARDSGAYRYFVINDKIKDCVDRILQIVRENQQA
jgi:guanylate kinase